MERTKKMDAMDMRKTTDRKKIGRKLSTLFGMVLLTSLCWGNVVFATNYVEKFASGIFFENLLWAAIIAVIVVVFISGIKRNYVGVLVALIVGGIVIFFISNPSKIQEIGNVIGGAIFG
ncbi:TcpD family membrane protein [Lachnospiraceae bacterium JLR.KK008]